MGYKPFLKDNWDIITVLIIYSILAGFLIHYFQFKIAGDEISYIDIAHAYAVGHWYNAVNGYWSPLYSWLMAPFIYIFGYKPLYGVYISKILSIIIGFFTILSVRRLSRTFRLDRTVERVLLIALVPSVIFFALLYNTPDLLLVLLLVLYLSIIYDPEYSSNPYYGLLCGLIGALAYFTKSFAFPFFLVHFILFNLIFYSKSELKIEKKKIFKGLLLGLVIFFVLSGLWVGVISEKYHRLTISTAGEYNQALVGPEYKVNIMDTGSSPIYYMGLIKPPNNDSVSIWDEFSYMGLNKWSPFASWNNMEYEIKLIFANIVYSFNIIESYMSAAVVILFFMLLLIFRFDIEKTAKNNLKYLILTIFIYVGGYCVITPEWRYLWLIFVLLMVSGFYMIDNINKSNLINLRLRNILLILFFFTLILQPVIEIDHFAEQSDNSYNLSILLQNEYNIHGNLASNEYSQMTTISYYLNSKYYGIPKATNNSTQLENELEANNINYYFLLNSNVSYNFSNYHEITNGKIDGLKIYSRN